MTSRAYFLLAAAVLPAALVAAGACGNAVSVNSSDNGSGGAGGFLFVVGGSGPGPGPGGHKTDGGLPDADDPGCRNKPPPIENFECNPYSQFNGDCAPGEACYIYVNYPSEPCGQEEYGAFCYPQGPGGQGDPCAGALDCQAGHVCVITGSGTQCVKLCHLRGEDGCAAGLVCEPIDVEGFGGCL
jgi:hypothetical protein